MRWSVVVLIVVLSVVVNADNCMRLQSLTLPETVLNNVSVSAVLTLQPTLHTTPNETFTLLITDDRTNILLKQEVSTSVDDNKYVTRLSRALSLTDSGSRVVTASLLSSACPDHTTTTAETHVIPAWLSLVPPIFTLVVAVVSKHVLFSLLCGVYTGAFLLYRYNPITAFIRLMDKIIIQQFASESHAVVILFTLMLAGTVAMIAKSGGAAGLARLAIRHANSSFAAQFATWMLGISIFFDDYANCLIVGNTARPITDRMRVSREKLSFIIDCTAAPIASIAPISSWVGFEISLIQDQFRQITELEKKSVYITFLETIPRRYYPIFLIGFVVMLICFKKDFGPMYTAEVRARTTGQTLNPDNLTAVDEDAKEAEDRLLQPKEGAPARWCNAVVPIFLLIIFTFVTLILDGVYVIKNDPSLTSYSIEAIFSKADSFRVLMWAAGFAFFLPMFMYWAQGIMTPKESCVVWIEGMKGLMEPTLVLLLAWSLGDVVKQLNLSGWMVKSLENSISIEYLPSVIFIFSGIIAFSTGSSWATMSILFPIVVPLSWNISHDYDAVVLNVATILAGSVFGDHCSPISDTTILSSISSRCNVNDHVKTQAPYAAIVAFVSVACGVLPGGASSVYDWYFALPIGLVILGAVIFFVGKPIETFSLIDGAEIDRVSGVSVKSINGRESVVIANSPVAEATVVYKGLDTPV